jgi:hypothetical protein
MPLVGWSEQLSQTIMQAQAALSNERPHIVKVKVESVL